MYMHLRGKDDPLKALLRTSNHGPDMHISLSG
jgi:hypothetical protein